MRSEKYFNPLPPHGGRLTDNLFGYCYLLFQSTPSAWRETVRNDLNGVEWKYFNPLPPHGGRPGQDGAVRIERRHFNPLPPHGGRPDRSHLQSYPNNFNPLPPHGGRRSGTCDSQQDRLDFNPLPPHGGRLLQMGRLSTVVSISIHSLRMEGDHNSRNLSSR